MDYVVKGGNAYGMLRIALNANELIYARENAIIAFSPQIVFTKSQNGGFLRRLARKFSGAHLDMQQINATEDKSWVMLAAPMAGSVTGIDLHGKNVLVIKEVFLAAARNVQTNGRLHTLDREKFIHENFQVIKFSGDGVVMLCATGSVEMMNLLQDQPIRIHPDHLIAWEESLVFSEPDRGFITITGPGRLWLQTRKHNNLKDGNKSANS